MSAGIDTTTGADDGPIRSSAPSVAGEKRRSGECSLKEMDPVTDIVHRIQAEEAGSVIGMALPQIVLSGYGILHSGEFASP